MCRGIRQRFICLYLRRKSARYAVIVKETVRIGVFDGGEVHPSHLVVHPVAIPAFAPRIDRVVAEREAEEPAPVGQGIERPRVAVELEQPRVVGDIQEPAVGDGDVPVLAARPVVVDGIVLHQHGGVLLGAGRPGQQAKCSQTYI